MHESALNETSPPPILCSIKHASAMIGRGTQAIYDLIGGGKIRAVKSDGRTLVVVASLHEYADNLPPAQIAAPRQRKPQHLRQAEADKPQQLPQMEAKTGPPRERRRLRQAQSETTNA
jgi:hypothetical protein